LSLTLFEALLHTFAYQIPALAHQRWLRLPVIVKRRGSADREWGSCQPVRSRSRDFVRASGSSQLAESIGSSPPELDQRFQQPALPFEL